MLKRLRQYKLYAKLFKYEFSIILIIFFRFVINTDKIEMDINKIEIIIKYSESKSFRNIQNFLCLTNFYRRFIKDYSRIAVSLTSMLKGSVNGRKVGLFEFIKKEKAAFELLKVFFTRASILIHFKPDRPIRVETNISNFTITEILSQSENG
jgi:hypothetical protein